LAGKFDLSWPAVRRPSRRLAPAGRWIAGRTARRCRLLGLLGVSLLATGCGSTVGDVTLGAVGATLVTGQAPTAEVQQTYYLGVTDPRGQVPPTIYRLRVHGQSSFINNTRFASGWVPAQVIDTLGTRISSDDNGQVTIDRDSADNRARLAGGRSFYDFGPEGTRPYPKDYRLVVVMGANPEAFFNAVDRTLGDVARIANGRVHAEAAQAMLEAANQLAAQEDRLQELQLMLANARSGSQDSGDSGSDPQ